MVFPTHSESVFWRAPSIIFNEMAMDEYNTPWWNEAPIIRTAIVFMQHNFFLCRYNGILFKSNWLPRCAFSYIGGLILNLHNIFRVVLALSNRHSRICIINSSSVLSKPEMKWFLIVWIGTSYQYNTRIFILPCSSFKASLLNWCNFDLDPLFRGRYGWFCMPG